MPYADPVYIEIQMPIESALNISGLIKRRIAELNHLVSSGLIPPQDDIIGYYTEGIRAINEALPKGLVS